MYKVLRSFDTYEILTATDSSTDSWFSVVPERGGIVISYGTNGHEWLFLNRETLIDAGKKIRGGIPILWPICSGLTNNEYQVGNTTYQLPSHGFARNLPWSVLQTSTDNEASITLELKATPETLASFPFSFRLMFRYVLQDGHLTIHQRYENLSDEPMPMYAGFHPYFRSAPKGMAEVRTNRNNTIKLNCSADTYIDGNNGQKYPFSGIVDVTDLKDSRFLNISRGGGDGQGSQLSFDDPTTKREIQMEYSPEFQFLVLWSLPEQDFMCIEPWMAMPNAMNTNQHVHHVNRNSPLESFIRLHVK